MSENGKPTPTPSDHDVPLPVRVEIFVEPDGTVVFADLAADLIPVAQAVDPAFAARAPEPSEGDA